MMKLQIIIFHLLLFNVNVSCQDEKSGSDRSDFERQKGDPVDGLRIAWNYSSMQKLSPHGDRTLSWTGYPRIRRLQNGSLLAVYEAEGNVELIRSDDNGSTWNAPEMLFEKHQASSPDGASAVVYKANGEMIQLANGDVVAACNYRPQPNGIAPFSIAVKRSHDSGKTWSDAEVIYEAGKDFRNGCWEPAFLQLPSGELQVYFANEAPYTQSDEQEISMLSSSDEGNTWSGEAVTVSFRKNHRDGMPVPVIGGDEILVAIEDNASGQFKPWIVRTPLDKPWIKPVDGDSPNREAAHHEELPDQVYAGAPYLVRLPSGELLLSYQTTRGRTDNWELSTMEVAIGDSEGRNFSRITQPFDVPLDREAKWNSISLWDENTVVAASTTSFRNPACEVWTILGHIVKEPVAPVSPVSVDGRLNENEWKERFPLFIGHKGMVNARADIARDDDFLYFAAKVNYESSEAIPGTTDDDGVTIYVDAGNYNLTSPDSGLFRVFCNRNEEFRFHEGRKGEWIHKEAEGIKLSTQDLENKGYRLELAIPFSALNYREGNDIRINVKLSYRDKDGSITEENIVHAVDDASNTWCRVKMKP
jgi:hypothetical protein